VLHGPQPVCIWLGEHGLPLYKLLKKFDYFRWTEERHKVLDELIALITKPSVLISLELGETLLLYVAVTTQVISVILVVKWRNPGPSKRCGGQSITLARSSLNARATTIRCKNYFTPF
jgi:hypothetical protein